MASHFSQDFRRLIRGDFFYDNSCPTRPPPVATHRIICSFLLFFFFVMSFRPGKRVTFSKPVLGVKNTKCVGYELSARIIDS